MCGYRYADTSAFLYFYLFYLATLLPLGEGPVRAGSVLEFGSWVESSSSHGRFQDFVVFVYMAYRVSGFRVHIQYRLPTEHTLTTMPPEARAQQRRLRPKPELPNLNSTWTPKNLPFSGSLK